VKGIAQATAAIINETMTIDSVLLMETYPLETMLAWTFLPIIM